MVEIFNHYLRKLRKTSIFSSANEWNLADKCLELVRKRGI